MVEVMAGGEARGADVSEAGAVMRMARQGRTRGTSSASIARIMDTTPIGVQRRREVAVAEMKLIM
jgi:hypothetical protein